MQPSAAPGDPHRNDAVLECTSKFETDWACLDWFCATLFAELSRAAQQGPVACPRCGGSVVEIPGWQDFPIAEDFGT